MEYKTVAGAGPEHVAATASELNIKGWQLMGPVVPVLHHRRDSTYLATMQRSAADLLEAMKITGRVPLDTRCLGED